jgi:hypothetical protein
MAHYDPSYLEIEVVVHSVLAVHVVCGATTTIQQLIYRHIAK